MWVCRVQVAGGSPSSMKHFELIEHTADTGIKAYGETLTELFENAAKGMFHILACGNAASEGAEALKNIELENNTDKLEELLVSWLSELLYIFNKEKICFNDFNVLSLNSEGMAAQAKGVHIDLYQSDRYTEIKAVTFHNLKIEEQIEGFSCTIIFDV